MGSKRPTPDKNKIKEINYSNPPINCPIKNNVGKLLFLILSISTSQSDIYGSKYLTETESN